MIRRGALLAAAAVVTTVPACNDTRADRALDAALQIEGAQFYRAALPADDGGPPVASVTIAERVVAGGSPSGFSGELDARALAVAVGLERDVGYWIVRAGIPSSAAPLSPTFQAGFAIAWTARPGDNPIVFRAVDAAGRFGPALVRPLRIVEPVPPSGRLVVSLRWNNGADLDLHVVLPTGVELFKRNRTEYERPPPSAGPLPPNAAIDGGVLDRDSNAQCVPDGQRAENAIWKGAPPSGHWIVRVDTSSLCGAPNAIWHVEARLDGVTVGAAEGTSTENDLRFEHNRGDGVFALEFDVP